MPVIKECKCSSCGGEIERVNNAEGICPFCDTPYFFEQIETFNRALEHEKINSGMNFKECKDKISGYIVEFLTKDPAAPLDILENVSVTSKKSICVPAYYYQATGKSDYMCEVGVDTKKYVNDGNGGTRTVTETTWTVIAGNTSASAQRTVSGNTQYDSVINELYGDDMSAVNNAMVDKESLEIPLGAEVVPFNIAETALNDKYICPDINNGLNESVNKLINGRKYRNLSIGNASINNDTLKRQLISLYNITFSDGTNNYSMYVSGDGAKHNINGTPPTDPQRSQEYNEIKNTFEEVNGRISKAKSLGTAGIIVAAILLIFGLWFISVPLAAVSIFFGFIKTKPDKEKRDEIQAQLDAYKNQIKEIRDNFLNSGRKIEIPDSDRTPVHN